MYSTTITENLHIVSISKFICFNFLFEFEIKIFLLEVEHGNLLRPSASETVTIYNKNYNIEKKA